jgi:hypothetical protein
MQSEDSTAVHSLKQGSVSFSFLFSETGSHYVAQAGLELTILLPQHPKCWDYRHAPHAWHHKQGFLRRLYNHLQRREHSSMAHASEAGICLNQEVMGTFF